MHTEYCLGISPEGFHKFAYTEWGQRTPNEVPVLCVHGLTRNRHDFDPIAEFLAYRGKHVYCPDVVGRGDSDWLKKPTSYTYEQYCQDMATLIARTQAEEVDWIGTSMGGVIGMMIAALPNSPIRKLVLNDIGPQVPIEAVKKRIKMYAGKKPVFKSKDEAIAYYKDIYKDFGELSKDQWNLVINNSIKEVSSGRFLPKVDPNIVNKPDAGKLIWGMLSNPKQTMQGVFKDIDWWPIWAKITCPVLVIHGEESDILLDDTVKKMQQTHNDVTVIKIPDVGHAPSLFESEYQEQIYNWLTHE